MTLDSLFLGKMQKICDYLHDNLGISKFKLYRLFIMSSISGYLLCFCIERSIPYFLFLLITSYSGISLIRMSLDEEAYFLEYNEVFQSFWNTKRGMRMLGFFWALGLMVISFKTDDLILKIIDVSMISNTLWMYVEGCLPKPPSKSKFKEKYENFKTKLGEILEPTAQPSPG